MQDQARHTQQSSSTDQVAAALKSQIQRLERMDANLYDDKIAGEISVEKYKLKHTELMTQKAALETRLSKLDQSVDDQLDQKLTLLQLSQKAAEIYKERGTNERRLIIIKLFEDLTCENGVVSVKYTNFARAIAQNVRKTRLIIGG